MSDTMTFEEAAERLNFYQFEAWLRTKPAMRAVPMPLFARGGAVVWNLQHHGATSGLSELHRVGDNGQTQCQRPLPKDGRRYVSLALPLTVPACDRCEMYHTAGATDDEIHHHMVREVA